MNRLSKALKTRSKQIKKEVKKLEKEARHIARFFGKRKPRKKRAAVAPKRKHTRKPKPAATATVTA
jgi:hypothetical protein